jgi:hypothetical protein
MVVSCYDLEGVAGFRRETHPRRSQDSSVVHLWLPGVGGSAGGIYATRPRAVCFAQRALDARRPRPRPAARFRRRELRGGAHLPFLWIHAPGGRQRFRARRGGGVHVRGALQRRLRARGRAALQRRGRPLQPRARAGGRDLGHRRRDRGRPESVVRGRRPGRPGCGPGERGPPGPALRAGHLRPHRLPERPEQRRSELRGSRRVRPLRGGRRDLRRLQAGRHGHVGPAAGHDQRHRVGPPGWSRLRGRRRQHPRPERRRRLLPDALRRVPEVQRHAHGHRERETAVREQRRRRRRAR